ncbi:hypothetical protein ACM66B_001018 [Microbotryomycetes sp. NB124-2]
MPSTTREPFAVLSLGSLLTSAATSRSPSPRKMARERHSTPRPLRVLYDKPPVSPARAMMLAEELQTLASDDDEDVQQPQPSPARRLLDAFVSSQTETSKRDRSTSVGSIGMRSRSRQSSPAIASSHVAHQGSPERGATRSFDDADKPAWTFYEDTGDEQAGSITATVDMVDLTEATTAVADDDEAVACSNENAAPPPRAASTISHRRSASLLSQSVSAADSAADERRALPASTPPMRDDLPLVSSTTSAAVASDLTVVPPSSGESRPLTQSPPASPPPLYPAWNEPVTSVLNDGGGLGSFGEGHASFASVEFGALRPAFGAGLEAATTGEEGLRAVQQRPKRKSEEGLEVGAEKRPKIGPEE